MLIKLLVVISSGDNILTAINVAEKCGMVSPEDTIVQVTSPTESRKGHLEYKTIRRSVINTNGADISDGDNQVQNLTLP